MFGNTQVQPLLVKSGSGVFSEEVLRRRSRRAEGRIRREISRHSSFRSDQVSFDSSHRRTQLFWKGVKVAVALCAAAALLTVFIRLRPGVKSWIEDYATIPFVAAFVGWGTNVLALHMTFYPIRFIGWFPNVQILGMPLFGWQGIIPMNCAKMAGMTVDMMTEQLIDVREVFSRLDPERVAMELAQPLGSIMPKLIQTLGAEKAPAVWDRLPKSAKAEIVRQALDESPQCISEMMTDVRNNITSVFSLHDMVVDMFNEDKQLMNDMFLTCGKAEFDFIRRSGLYLGFLFGLAQMLLWMVCDRWWVLPLAGFVVGYLTNYVALKIIFHPVRPRDFGCLTIQGLFLKRQQEVADIYADMVSENVLSAEHLLSSMVKGAYSNRLFEVMDKHIHAGIDALVGSQWLAEHIVGSKEYEEIKLRVSEYLKDDMEQFFPHLTPYLDEALDIRETLATSMRKLSPEAFEGLLHPVFEEDEFKLILVGGVLGVLVGLVQALVQVPEQFAVV